MVRRRIIIIIIVMITIVLLLKTGKFAYVYMYDQMRVRKEGRKEVLNPLNSLIRLDTGQGFIGAVDLSGRDSCTFLRCM